MHKEFQDLATSGVVTTFWRGIAELSTVRSAHIRLINSVLNNALRIVTGCLRPTPTGHLPVLSGIQLSFAE